MELKNLKEMFSLSPSLPGGQQLSSENIQSTETYVEYGKRVCGIVTGNNNSLSIFLQKVYQTEKNRQVNDHRLQQDKKTKLQQKLSGEKSQEQSINAEIANTQLKIDETNEQINELDIALSNAKANDGKENKMAKIKLIIGIVILIILTTYLFIFYSSTFYSAFLLTATQLISMGQNALSIAMFNTNAIPEAYNQGFGALTFILSAPIIFMALGYCLHYFMEQTGIGKWIKASLLLLITLSFDCILAYKIGDLLYQITAISNWSDLPPYSLNIALCDVNSWAVIFCGFIVYLVWGIVFNMSMTAYTDLRSNKKEINSIKTRINHAKKELSTLQQNIAPLKATLQTHQHNIHQLEEQLQKGYFINTQIMKVALSDFFAGWVAVMTILIPETSKHQAANDIYNNFIINVQSHA